MEVRNRFKGLDLIDRMPDELWTLINMGVIPSSNGVTPEQHLASVASFLNSVKANANDWVSYQCVMFLPNLYIAANAWEEGTNEYKLVYNGNDERCLSCRDYFDAFSAQYFENEEIGFVNTFNAFMAEILCYFQTYSEGLAASYPTGETFTDDGTHPNHKGVDTYFKYIKPLFLN